MTSSSRRFLLPVLGLLLGVILLVGGFVLRETPGPASASGIGGPFSLTDQDGKTVTEAALKGRPTLVFFGYTHCPDVCPTTLSDLSQMLAALGPGKNAGVLFITVDPERDTPGVLKDYLSSFDPRIVGLTGDRTAVEAALRDYRVYAKKVPTQGDDYTMDHTAVVYLMDKTGTFVESFNPELEKPKEAAAAFAKYL